MIKISRILLGFPYLASEIISPNYLPIFRGCVLNLIQLPLMPVGSLLEQLRSLLLLEGEMTMKTSNILT